MVHVFCVCVWFFFQSFEPCNIYLLFIQTILKSLTVIKKFCIDKDHLDDIRNIIVHDGRISSLVYCKHINLPSEFHESCISVRQITLHYDSISFRSFPIILCKILVRTEKINALLTSPLAMITMPFTVCNQSVLRHIFNQHSLKQCFLFVV